jgi:hypothetical protein
MRWFWQTDTDRREPVALAPVDDAQRRALNVSGQEYREEIERRLRLLELQMIVFAREGGR